MSIDPNKAKQIHAQFLANRQAALKSLMDAPSEYIAGQSDALGISYESAASLVAFGMAVVVRDMATKAVAEEATKSAAAAAPEAAVSE